MDSCAHKFVHDVDLVESEEEHLKELHEYHEVIEARGDTSLV